MAEEKATPAGTSEFPVNQRLLEESLKLKEERRILKERLTKVEEKRGDVSKAVYEKVHADYIGRLQSLQDQLLEKKQDIDRELASLYETRDKIQANLKNHKETLEELQFRHHLGEFSKSDYEKQSKAAEDKVTRFEQVLTAVQTNIRRYESIFEGEEALAPEVPPSIKEEAAEEVDEWEKEAKEAALQEMEGGNGKEWMETTKPGAEIHPKLTIISGKENVGKSFVVNGSLTIGRSHTNQIILKDAKVSRQHAELKVQGVECLLIDLNSSNGTAVNGQKVHEHILTANDEIQVGDFVLQYQV